MNKVHISIPEFDEAGLTYEECFRMIFVFIKHEVSHLKNIHSSDCIDDLAAYPLQIASRVLKTASTLHSIIERDKDYVVANAVVRIIADSIATLYLIYQSNENQMVLRHYLYIMDGVSNRLKYLPQRMEYDKRIKETEFRALENQVTESKRNYEGAYQHCILQIHSLSLYDGNKYAIDNLIKNCNWKFKTISASCNNKNQYNWKDMYKILNMNCDSGLFSFLGEFVHGLSTSNMVFETDGLCFEPIYGTSIALLGRLNDFFNAYYNKAISYYHTNNYEKCSDELIKLYKNESILKTEKIKDIIIKSIIELANKNIDTSIRFCNDENIDYKSLNISDNNKQSLFSRIKNILG